LNRLTTAHRSAEAAFGIDHPLKMFAEVKRVFLTMSSSSAVLAVNPKKTAADAGSAAETLASLHQLEWQSSERKQRKQRKTASHRATIDCYNHL
jgi:hypothetical protein